MLLSSQFASQTVRLRKRFTLAVSLIEYIPTPALPNLLVVRLLDDSDSLHSQLLLTPRRAQSAQKCQRQYLANNSLTSHWEQPHGLAFSRSEHWWWVHSQNERHSTIEQWAHARLERLIGHFSQLLTYSVVNETERETVVIHVQRAHASSSKLSTSSKVTANRIRSGGPLASKSNKKRVDCER